MFWDNVINIVEYCFILLFFDVGPKCWKKELFLSKNASVHPLDRYWTFYFGEKVWFFRLLPAWLKVSIFDVLRQFNQHCWILLYSSFLWRPAKMLEKRTFLTKKVLQGPKFTIQSSRRSKNQVQRSKKIKRSKIKLFHGSTDQSSSKIKDQQDQRSKSPTGDQVPSDHRSKVQSSTFHRSDH